MIMIIIIDTQSIEQFKIEINIFFFRIICPTKSVVTGQAPVASNQLTNR